MISLKSLSLVCASSYLGAALCAHAEAPNFPKIQDLYPTSSEISSTGSDINYVLSFGLNLALCDNTLVATEPYGDPPRIAVFTRKSNSAPWERSASLYVPVPGTWDDRWKSSRLAIDGDVVLAAIKRTVYVFKKTNGRWSLVQRVKPPSPDGVTDYPEKLAFHAGTAVVTGSTPSEGIAYVYTVQADGRLAWQAKLRSLSGVPGDGFGASVDIHNDTIAIGAPGVKSVFVFKRSGSTWKRMQQVMPIEPESAVTFGSALAVDANTLVVGAPEALPEGQFESMQVGAAYIFALSHGAFAQVSVLHPGPQDNPSDVDYGRIVRLTPDRLVVSAHYEYVDGPYNTPGESFTYERSGSAMQLLGIARDFFADPWDMVTDGTQLVVSGPGVRDAIGSAEVFNIRNIKATN
jgi:hypothetical protein